MGNIYKIPVLKRQSLIRSKYSRGEGKELLGDTVHRN